MNKKYILRKNIDIENVIKNGKKLVNKFFVVYYYPNNISNSRFCVSVNKKIGKAYIRNSFKRKIKDIIYKNKLYNKKYDYVIIVRNSVLNLDYFDIKRELINLMKGEE